MEKRVKSTQKSFTCPPCLRLDDQKSAVLSCEFHPSGDYFLSANRAGQIRLDSISSAILKTEAHTGAVMEAHFCRDGTNIYTCSEDATLGIWDGFTGLKTCTLEGHKGTVNSVESTTTGHPVLCSGGQDGSIRIWDAREGDCVLRLETGSEVTSTIFSESGDYVFSGGQGKSVSIWDLRASNVICSLDGHTDTITGLALSPCGSYILSHSLDNTLRIWDIRPYTSLDRVVQCFPSSQYYPSALSRCTWSPDGSMVAAGTAGGVVQVLDVSTGEVLLDLSSPEGNVNDVAFHPDEPLALTASSDKCLFLHELTK